MSPTYRSVKSERVPFFCASKARGLAQRGRPVALRGKASHDPNAFVEVMRDAGMEPLDDFPGRHARWHCRCGVCGTTEGGWNSVRAGWLHPLRAEEGGCCGPLASTRRLVDRCGDERRRIGSPRTVSRAGKPWLCRCTSCDREVTARLTGLRTGEESRQRHTDSSSRFDYHRRIHRVVVAFRMSLRPERAVRHSVE